MKTQRSIFLLLLCCLIVQNLATKRFLKFNEDGEFKIAQFTDLHFGVDRYDVKTIGVQRILLDLEQPDFVALTGDTITGRYSDTVEKGKKAWNKAVGEMAKRDIPWGLKQVQKGNCGNFNLEKIDLILKRLIKENPRLHGRFGYGCVQPNQIDWFNEVSSEFSREYPNHMGIVLFHIPLPEMLEFWHTDISFGTQEEIVCCPQNNTGLYQAMVDNGNIKLVLNGHDHINDYCTRSKSRAPDLWMCYGRKTGYGYYNPVPPMYHGARIIQLFNNQTTGTTFTTWIRDRQRRKIFQHLHKPDCILDEQCVLPKV
ncbi:hypothetical protein M0813_20181 [Anaeramoeba flamelloides]|uniref:Calcineurin-like phosphoesterase domain-containing protein n=1 Tax=Anaeramoeba flamelloides TaxID=1746091 RepID=A0ABQ8YMD9_9EUKA|nr:hypothetical protein M0813_20181 [Anaeramoeba flamelloides]